MKAKEKIFLVTAYHNDGTKKFRIIKMRKTEIIKNMKLGVKSGRIRRYSIKTL